MTNASTSILSTNATEGLRDIVGPVPVTSLVAQLLFWGTLAALLTAAAFIARWWWRRRQRRLQESPPPPPPIPPHELARRRLEAALTFLGDPTASAPRSPPPFAITLKAGSAGTPPTGPPKSSLANFEPRRGSRSPYSNECRNS